MNFMTGFRFERDINLVEFTLVIDIQKEWTRRASQLFRLKGREVNSDDLNFRWYISIG